jgi:formamidopyrimidine-DNA glycosylase
MGERELWGIPVIQSMGPDPLLDGVNASVLRKALADTSRPVKVALMDPEVIAGIGNIQATEALFRAEIHPARPANSLSSTEVRAVAKGIRRSIEYTLTNLEKPEAAGRVEYVSAGGDNPFLIYDRAGEPCPRCGTELEKMTLGGRTTVYCLVCQR